MGGRADLEAEVLLPRRPQELLPAGLRRPGLRQEGGGLPHRRRDHRDNGGPCLTVRPARPVGYLIMLFWWGCLQYLFFPNDAPRHSPELSGADSHWSPVFGRRTPAAGHRFLGAPGCNG